MRGRSFVPAILLSIALTAGAGAVRAADFTESARIATDRLTIANLIGEVRIEGHAGSEFEIEIDVRGEDASRDLVSVQIDRGAEARVAVVFPVDRHREYVYPEGRTNTRLRVGDDRGWLSTLLGRNQVEVSTGGSGLRLWADVTVRVPAGASLTLDHGVGKVSATSIEAGLSVDGAVSRIAISSLTGDLSLDVGSGSVAAETVRGSVSIDTGSGAIDLTDVEGGTVSIDSGSGRIRIEGITTERLSIDTGSGSVRASGVRAGEVSIDTGSGPVELRLDEMTAGGYDVDTGSGSITLGLPAAASAAIVAETGSGGIHVGVEGASVVHRERDEIELRLGNGGARVSLETGSGGIRIEQSGS